jgi:hypothetical protein
VRTSAAAVVVVVHELAEVVVIANVRAGRTRALEITPGGRQGAVVPHCRFRLMTVNIPADRNVKRYGEVHAYR